MQKSSFHILDDTLNWFNLCNVNFSSRMLLKGRSVHLVFKLKYFLRDWLFLGSVPRVHYHIKYYSIENLWKSISNTSVVDFIGEIQKVGEFLHLFSQFYILYPVLFQTIKKTLVWDDVPVNILLLFILIYTKNFINYRLNPMTFLVLRRVEKLQGF